MKKLFLIALCLLAVVAIAGPITFRTITLKIPSTFTAEQEAFIIKSAMNQIEAEMLKTLAIPALDVANVQTNVDSLLKTNSLPPKYYPTNKVEVSEEPKG